jgi:glycine/D-amino acid oxidase-like deaminating enzyme
MTTDNLPRFHKFGPNVIGTSGYNGRGISPGTVFGKLLAEHVSGRLAEGDMPLPLTEVSLPAFRRSKEAYYEIGAQVAHFAGSRF